MNEKTEKDTTKMAQTLERLMESLAGVMEKEMKFLDAKKLEDVAALREEKAQLVRDYKNNITILSNQPELLKGAPEEMRVRLRLVGEKLADLTGRNALMLRAAISSTQSLIQTVVEAARAGMKTHDSYDDPRKVSSNLGGYSPVCDPVAINKTV